MQLINLLSCVYLLHALSHFLISVSMSDASEVFSLHLPNRINSQLNFLNLAIFVNGYYFESTKLQLVVILAFALTQDGFHHHLFAVLVIGRILPIFF